MRNERTQQRVLKMKMNNRREKRRNGRENKKSNEREQRE
jgi:hypothetical protein